MVAVLVTAAVNVTRGGSQVARAVTCGEEGRFLPGEGGRGHGRGGGSCGG